MTRALLGALAALLLLAPAAHAAPILGEADAADLAEQLEEARAATGVCFGWSVRVDDQSGATAGGIDASPVSAVGGAEPCARSLRLIGLLIYTSEASEAEDSADVTLEQRGLPGATFARLRDLVGRDAGELLGEDDDKALFELVAGLPLLAAEVDPSLAGRLPRVETGGAPPDAAVGASPGSDWLRTYFPYLAAGLLLAALAAWLLVSGLRGRRRDHPRRPRSA